VNADTVVTAPLPDHSADAGMLLEILNGLDAAVTCYDRDDRLVFWNVAAEIFIPKAAHT
jgi:hypothetical protein